MKNKDEQNVGLKDFVIKSQECDWKGQFWNGKVFLVQKAGKKPVAPTFMP